MQACMRGSRSHGDYRADFLWLGTYALITKLDPFLKPFWSDYTALTSQIPILGVATMSVGQFLTMIIGLSLLAIFLEYIHMPIVSAALLIASSFFIIGSQSIETIWFWLRYLLIGIALFITYQFIMKKDYRSLPIGCATFMTMGLVQQSLLCAFPSQFVASICAIIVLWLIACLFMKFGRH